jgi:hypothetical protein
VLSLPNYQLLKYETRQENHISNSYSVM